MPFSFKRLEIPDVIVIEPKSFEDTRGVFFENFKESEFTLNGISTKFVQDNSSQSLKSVIRGLHYQNNPKAQAKLISVLKGEIFDVAVDIRRNSPTFGKWVSEVLSEKNHKLLYVPEGFAHGFCVTTDESYVYYKVSNEYSSEHEQGILWNDPKLNIKWPVTKPVISEKDSQLPLLENLDNDFL